MHSSIYHPFASLSDLPPYFLGGCGVCVLEEGFCPVILFIGIEKAKVFKSLHLIKCKSQQGTQLQHLLTDNHLHRLCQWKEEMVFPCQTKVREAGIKLASHIFSTVPSQTTAIDFPLPLAGLSNMRNIFPWKAVVALSRGILPYSYRWLLALFYDTGQRCQSYPQPMICSSQQQQKKSGGSREAPENPPSHHRK